jgi:hypothetical protein
LTIPSYLLEFLLLQPLVVASANTLMAAHVTRVLGNLQAMFMTIFSMNLFFSY